MKDEMTAFEKAQLALQERLLAATERQNELTEKQIALNAPIIKPEDPRGFVQMHREAARADARSRDVREIHGMLKLIDGSHATYRGSGRVLGTVAAKLTVDFTKNPAGVIIEVQYPFDLAVEAYDKEFRAAKAADYAASEGSPEHEQHLEKERLQFIRANNYFRCTAHVLNSLVGRLLTGDEDVKLIFTPDAPTDAAAAAE
jgi:hypothetical protein